MALHRFVQPMWICDNSRVLLSHFHLWCKLTLHHCGIQDEDLLRDVLLTWTTAELLVAAVGPFFVFFWFVIKCRCGKLAHLGRLVDASHQQICRSSGRHCFGQSRQGRDLGDWLFKWQRFKTNQTCPLALSASPHVGSLHGSHYRTQGTMETQ